MKLFSLTIKYYIIFSVFLLLVGVPLSYFIVNKLIIHEIDETLLARKEVVLPKIDRYKPAPGDSTNKNVHDDMSIVPASWSKYNDTIYDIYLYNDMDGEKKLYRELSSYVVIDGKPYHLKLQGSLVKAKILVRSVVTVQGILLSILLTGLLIINGSISKRIWTPFYKTIGNLKSIEVEKSPDFQMENTQIEEFKDLNNAIDQLVKRNYKVFQNQKQFTENAAHEIQTPLALIQSKLDLLMQTPNLSAEQAKIIDYITDYLVRLSKLNKSLLLLSKIDNGQFIETEKIDLGSILENIFEQYDDRILTKHISLNKTIIQFPALNANITLIEVLFSNLIRNSINHNVEFGVINIIIDKSKIVIENSGKPLRSAPEILFERFQKESRDSSNIGLGLAIVKKICEIYQYKISYLNKGETHSIEIQF